MSNDFDVRRCKREDYSEFLDVLNEAFGHSAESRWFQKNINNCTPYPELATDDQIDKHVIAVDRSSGEIMGGVGAYPLDLVVSEDSPEGDSFTLPVIGIGQVGCIAKYRNRGVMSATLKTALDDAKQDGAVAGFLGGDRYRYGRFGFDYGGANLSLGFRQNRLKTAAEAANLKTRVAGEPDIGELNSMYETYPSYIKRSPQYWKMQFGRKVFIWRLGAMNGGSAYIAYGENKEEIAEIRGDPQTALAMIYNHMESNGLEKVSISAPYSPGRGGPLYESLRAVSSSTRVSPCGMNLIAIFFARKLYEILEPAIRRMGIKPSGDEDLNGLLGYLLGSPGHPYPDALRRAASASGASGSGNTAVRPFTVWIPEADNV